MTHSTYGAIIMTDDRREHRDDLASEGTKNRIDGAGDKLSGRARNALGALTGDDSQQLKGKGQELKGEAKDALGKAQQKADRALNDTDRDRR
jgi:uncharacterized protein YjbJ (UPF0337 family)